MLLMKFLFIIMSDSPVFLSVVVVKSGIVVSAAVTVNVEYNSPLVVLVVSVTVVLATVVISLT